MTTAIINPLGQALAHYTRALHGHFQNAGAPARVIEFDEPSVSGTGRAKWVATYRAALASARQDSSKAFITWPALGLLDAPLVAATFRSPSTIVLHDPRPLVRSVGYGRTARGVARVCRDVTYVTHSRLAEDHAHQILRGGSLRLLPHPIMRLPDAPPTESPTVRVLGQFKATRSLKVVEEIGKTFSGVRLEIVGRGWPDVEGWKVTDQFVPEGELDRLVSTSSAVVVPYDRFYQSGIAIRCLEKGVPFVGPRDSSLADLLPQDTALLVDSDNPWSDALRAAIDTDRRAMQTARDDYIIYADHALAGYALESQT